ncbi:hypothetical protein LVJ83_01050 [Uruburuella testudinis]|uniref:Uncharacterized protein n=1 Tax=Uruburuella testudinis TaxID=1282863 RepID=A0ABY4DSR6_9NEIS|nr:hypothetical protein [Uruburuella testudinis]UOO82096.1 hypothetical protein LVJ83_01050 [Uruburuella testudinis]
MADLGTAGEWVNAVIAAAALFFAWAAGRQAKQLYQDGREKEQKLEQLRRRSEPAKLSVWFAADKQNTAAWGLVLNNVGERPFYNLHIRGRYRTQVSDTEFTYQYAVVVPPGKFFVPYQTIPNSPYPFQHPREYDEAALTPLLTTKKHIIGKISFTDSDNFQWESDGLGNLQEATNPAIPS